MQSIENWSELCGKVRKITVDPHRVGFRRIWLDVERVKPVESFPPAVAFSLGSVVDISVAVDTVNVIGLEAGNDVELQVRSTSTGLFAHPDHVRVTGHPK